MVGRGLNLTLLAVAICTGTSDVLALQQISGTAEPLTGRVRDAMTDLLLSGASVAVEGTERRTSTDDAGRFSLDALPEGLHVLRVSRFGYDEELVPVHVGDVSAPLEVYLRPRPIEIEGVGVVGHSVVTLHGAVIDARSGEGLPWALLRVGNGRRQWADDRGAFRMEGLEPGSRLLYAERLGYESVYVPVRLFGGMEPIPVELEPDSILLRGIEVMVGRFRSRRNGYGFGPVRAFDERRLRHSSAPDIETFLRSRDLVPRSTEPRVIIDELPVPCGLSTLATYPPEDVYLIEVYDRGGQIRLYTQTYMRQAGREPRTLIPANLLPPVAEAC